MFTLGSTVYQSPTTCGRLCLRSLCLRSTSAWGNGEFRFWTNTRTHSQKSTLSPLFQRSKVTGSPQPHNIRKPSILRGSANPSHIIVMHIYPDYMRDQNAANKIFILLWQMAAISFSNYYIGCCCLACKMCKSEFVSSWQRFIVEKPSPPRCCSHKRRSVLKRF